MAQYILALDQGTTSSRAILFDKQQNIIGISQKEFTQHYPKEGWVEHDPMEIYSSQYAVMMEVIAQSGVDVKDIKGIGITNQRETTILWDAKTGRPVYNAIVWQCRRTHTTCSYRGTCPRTCRWSDRRTCHNLCRGRVSAGRLP